MKTLCMLAVGLVCLLSACSKEPETVDELRQAGIEAFLDQDYAGARDLLRTALATTPSDRDLLYFMGVSCQRDYMLDSALVYLKRCALLHKNDREANKELLDIALTLKEWRIAQQAVGVLIATGDPEERHYLLLAEIFSHLDHPLNELYFYRHYLALHPEDSTVYLRAANAAIVVDSPAVGLALIDTAEARFGNSVGIDVTRAMIYGSQRRFSQAEKILRDLLKDDTGSVYIKMNLGHILGAQDSRKKKREALDLYQEVRPQMGANPVLDSIMTELGETVG